MADRFSTNAESPSSPPQRAATVTPNDSEDLPDVTKGIHCNAAGDLVAIFKGDDTAVTLNLLAGRTYRYRLRRVLATGTTATVVAFV